MAATESDLGRLPASGTWRTPLLIIVCGCAIALLSFGPRSGLGFFIQPMSRDFAWGRDIFGLALALQNLLWGLGQPIAGAIADRFGVLRVICAGAVLYAAGLLLMSHATTPLSLDIGAGVLIGFGLSGCSFNLVLSAFSKLLPPERRGVALGAAISLSQPVFASARIRRARLQTRFPLSMGSLPDKRREMLRWPLSKRSGSTKQRKARPPRWLHSTKLN